MSTRYTQFPGSIKREATGYEGTNVPDDFVLPSCTLEDADRSVFNLFNEQLPLQFYQNGELKRIPVIFATGERFAVLNRKEPLRDRNKTLILPLVSIMRSGINQTPDNHHGPGQMHPTKLKIKISPESDTYQRLVNKLGLSNQDNLASESHLSDGGVLPGTVATRRERSTQAQSTIEGKLLTPSLEDNIYEIITMPPVKFYQATYNVTIWAQFTKQMNEILSAIMSSYQNNYGRTFRLETSKGYWFVGYVASDFSAGENYDDFTDSERLIKQSFDIKVNAYLVMPEFPGSPNGLRRSISAPTIEFTVTSINTEISQNMNANVPSHSKEAFILDDISNVGDGLPGQAIAVNEVNSGLARIGENVDQSSVIDDSNLQGPSVVGEFAAGKDDLILYRYDVNPFTGKRKKIPVRARKMRPVAGGSESRQGETIYREEWIVDIGDI